MTTPEHYKLSDVAGWAGVTVSTLHRWVRDRTVHAVNPRPGIGEGAVRFTKSQMWQVKAVAVLVEAGIRPSLVRRLGLVRAVTDLQAAVATAETCVLESNKAR